MYPPPWGIKLGDVYFIKMLDFCHGSGLRRSNVFVFYPKSDLFVIFLIKMFAFVVGVACGAQKFLYFTSKMTFSRYFESWVARRGKKLEHCCPKTMRIVKNVKTHQKPKFVLMVVLLLLV